MARDLGATTRGALATKKITWVQGENAPRIEPYGRAAQFSFTEVALSGPDELVRLLRLLEHRPRRFIVRRKPKDCIDCSMARRLVRDRRNSDGSITPATLEACAHYWIALDCDRIPCPDCIDPLFEPDWAVEHVVSALPVEFHGATCWWQFTSSAGIKPGISLRLFSWADRPVADWELKIWLAGSPVDHAIFEPAQPIYVAWPIFEGGPDPVPYRSWVWYGDRGMVTPPLIEKPTARIACAPSRPFSGEPGSGYEFHRARIGDHKGGDGFYRPVKAAAASWIGRHGWTVDTAWLRQDLVCAVREAPRDPQKHPDDYIEFRVADLNTLIPAIVELQRTKEGSRQSFAQCEPTYPASMGSVAEARALLARAFDEHIASIAIYADATAAYNTDLEAWQSQQPG